MLYDPTIFILFNFRTPKICLTHAEIMKDLSYLFNDATKFQNLLERKYIIGEEDSRKSIHTFYRIMWTYKLSTFLISSFSLERPYFWLHELSNYRSIILFAKGTSLFINLIKLAAERWIESLRFNILNEYILIVFADERQWMYMFLKSFVLKRMWAIV